MDNKQKNKIKSAYQELSELLNSFKNNELTSKEVLEKIQLKENAVRPYSKILDNGKISLNEITDKPIILEKDDWLQITQIMKEEKWEKFTQTLKNGYIDKYIFYNDNRIKNKKNQIKTITVVNDNTLDNQKEEQLLEENIKEFIKEYKKENIKEDVKEENYSNKNI